MRNVNIYNNLIMQADKVRRHCRQGSYKTRERYYEGYKRFLRYLADTYKLQKIANISGKHLGSYVKYLQEKELSASTIKTDLAAIRYFHNQMPYAKYELPHNDVLELERRSFRGHDRTWTDWEFYYLVAETQKVGLDRYTAALYLARYMGLRIHEVFKIDTAIVNAAFKSGLMTIKGKGGLQRDIPLDSRVEYLLKNLMVITRPGQKLFVSSERKTHNAIKELQQYIADTRIPDNGQPDHVITFHGLRHNFACETYMRLTGEGKSPRDAKRQISKWMGHRRIEIVDIYLASLNQDGTVMR